MDSYIRGMSVRSSVDQQLHCRSAVFPGFLLLGSTSLLTHWIGESEKFIRVSTILLLIPKFRLFQELLPVVSRQLFPPLQPGVSIVELVGKLPFYMSLQRKEATSSAPFSDEGDGFGVASSLAASAIQLPS